MRHVLFFSAYFILSTSAVAEQPSDYAYGIPIKVEGQEAVYQVDIPFEVYEKMARQDLGDVRVFNGQNEVVPYMIRSVGQNVVKEKLPPSRPAIYFPLYGEANVKPAELNIQIDKNYDGTIIRIYNKDPKKSKEKDQLLGYIVDLGDVKTPLSSLIFDWKTPIDTKEGFAVQMLIETSEDLVQWQVWKERVPLVHLLFNNESLRQNTVPLNGLQSKYLRLSWPYNQKSIEFTSMRYQPVAKITVEQPRVWKSIVATAHPNIPHQYYFDLGAPIPIDRLQIELPNVNTIALTQMFSRHKPEGKWNLVTTNTLYRLQQGEQSFVNNEISIPLVENRYWFMQVTDKGGGLGAGLPTLKVGWVPHQVVFVKRGTPPFLLAYGNVQAKPSTFPIEMVIPPNTTIKPAQLEHVSTSGNSGEVTTKQIKLGGEPQRREPLIDTKKWALWGVLALGVVLLGGMAYRLVKQMGRKTK